MLPDCALGLAQENPRKNPVIPIAPSSISLFEALGESRIHDSPSSRELLRGFFDLSFVDKSHSENDASCPGGCRSVGCLSFENASSAAPGNLHIDNARDSRGWPAH